jgi:hypothetical protein
VAQGDRECGLTNRWSGCVIDRGPSKDVGLRALRSTVRQYGDATPAADDTFFRLPRVGVLK